jgi:pilus assembly protein Flp/PilA
MRVRLQQFASDESGATAIEYGLIAALISLAIIGGVGQFATALELLYGDNGGPITQALNNEGG